jgi:hypothetical protein
LGIRQAGLSEERHEMKEISDMSLLTTMPSKPNNIHIAFNYQEVVMKILEGKMANIEAKLRAEAANDKATP